MFYKLFILKKAAAGCTERFLLLAVLILVVGALLTLMVWSFKRQSPKEPEADERDKLIYNRAAMVFLISAWIVLPVVGVIPQLILGYNGCVPAWSLPLINFGALVILMMIYSAAVLAQYFFRSGDGNK